MEGAPKGGGYGRIRGGGAGKVPKGRGPWREKEAGKQRGTLEGGRGPWVLQILAWREEGAPEGGGGSGGRRGPRGTQSEFQEWIPAAETLCLRPWGSEIGARDGSADRGEGWGLYSQRRGCVDHWCGGRAGHPGQELGEGFPHTDAAGAPGRHPEVSCHRSLRRQLRGTPCPRRNHPSPPSSPGGSIHTLSTIDST